MNHSNNSHFKGVDPLTHVESKRQEMALEIHGQETSGHIAATFDSIRDTAIFLLLLWSSLFSLQIPPQTIFKILVLSAIGWMIWKTGRTGWIAWSRLERLHRLMEQERWEIIHHRQQEREELQVLYSKKGFEGQLLEEVCDVLMADNDRLLHVMLEEEMGLSLESYEHPLKQSLGSFLGTFFTSTISLSLFFVFHSYLFTLAPLLLCALSGAMTAYSQKNKVVSAFIWNLGLGIVSFSTILFTYKIINTLFI
jgi:vacuolar iron transporter family protein